MVCVKITFAFHNCFKYNYDELWIEVEVIYFQYTIPSKFTHWSIVVLQFCDLSSTRNITVLGVSFLMGLMIPEWLSENAEKVKTGQAIGIYIFVIQ